jgi:small GTP-binding protein
MEESGAYQSCDATGTIKILLIGNSSVGKSCLLARYSEGDYSEEHKTTIGMDFKLRQLDVDGRIMKLQIWDTAGQERFRTITRAYYRGASAVIIVYDVTDEKSFRDVHNWYEMAKENASQEVVMVLCANKLDMAERSPRNSRLAEADGGAEGRQEGADGGGGAISGASEVNDGARVGEEAEEGGDKEIEQCLPRRVVSSARGRALAQEYSIAYFETSAKENIDVDELFFSVSKECLKQARGETLRNRDKQRVKRRSLVAGRNGDRSQDAGSCC